MVLSLVVQRPTVLLNSWSGKVCIWSREVSFVCRGIDWVDTGVAFEISIGAQKVKAVCIKFRNCCEARDREG